MAAPRQSWKDLIRTRTPVRVVMIINHKENILASTDSTFLRDVVLEQLQANAVDSRVLIVKRLPRLTTMVLDLFHTTYDFMTADEAENLPVIVIRIYRYQVQVFVASAEERGRANDSVAERHYLNGFVEPPFEMDLCNGKVARHLNPRPRKFKISEDLPEGQAEDRQE